MSRLLRNLRVHGGVIMLGLSIGWSAGASELFRFEQRGASSDVGLRLQNTVEEHAIDLDVALLGVDPETLSFALPDGTAVAAKRMSSEQRGDGSAVWRGEIEVVDRERSFGQVSLSSMQGRVAGWFSVDGRQFEILPGRGGRHRLIEVEAHAGGTCASVRPSADFTRQLTKPFAKDPGLKMALRIDVAAVFPDAFLADPAKEADVLTRIRAWFDDANGVLSRTGANTELNLVYVGPLYGTQPPVIDDGALRPAVSEALNWLDDPQPEVEALRTSLGADLAMLFIPGDRQVQCGAANLAMPPYAVIEIDCASAEFLVAHELGHLLGMAHARGETGDAPTIPYAHGWDDDNDLRVFGQRLATVMACNREAGLPIPLTGNQCNRIALYSSRDFQFFGIPMGTPDNDNARVAREQVAALAAIRPELPPTVDRAPALRIETPVDGARNWARAGLTLRASAWDPEEGNLSSRILWRSSALGVLGVGPEVRPAIPAFGDHTVTAEVTDSAGNRRVSTVNLRGSATVDPVGGIWHNPLIPGEFVAFNRNVHDQWVLTFFTYRNGRPHWYLSSSSRLTSGGTWRGNLSSFRFNNGVQTATDAGTVFVAVEADRQLSVTVTLLGQPLRRMLLEPLTRGNGVSGMYFTTRANGSVDDGFLVFRGRLVLNGRDFVLVATYDGANPVWTVSQTRQIALALEVLNPFLLDPRDNDRFDEGFNTRGGVGLDVGRLSFQNGQIRPAFTFPSGNTWQRGTFQDLVRLTVR